MCGKMKLVERLVREMVEVKLKDRAFTRLLIAKTGKSLRAFSSDVGMSQAYLSQILRGSKNPSPTIAYKMATGLNLNIDDIFLVNVIDITINGGEENARN